MNETVFTKTRRNLAGVQVNMMITDPDRSRVLAGMACCTLGNEMYEALNKLLELHNHEVYMADTWNKVFNDVKIILAKARGED